MILRSELAGSSLTNYWVPNLIEHLALSAEGGSAADADDHFELSSLFAGDNVHLTPLGYGRLAVCIASGIQEAVKRRLESECEVTCVLKNFHWRGFTSHNGISRPKLSQHALKMWGRGGRGGPGRAFGHGGGGQGWGGSRPHIPYSR